MINVTNIQKVFRTEEVETWALNNVSLSVKKGEFVAIMGPSGCGKSTLLNILGLLDNPTSGTYELNGKEVSKYTESQRTDLRKGVIGFVFQSFNLIDELNVYENIELPLLYMGISAKERKLRVEEAMDRMAIAHRAKHFPQQLSGGQQQRVALAAILVMGQDILVIDEPTSQLDPQSTDDIFEIIQLMKNMGKTIILVEHKMEQIAEYADHVVVLDHGAVVMEGSPKEVFSNPDCIVYHTRLPQCTKIAMELQKAGIRLPEVPVTVEQTISVIRQAAAHNKGGN